MKTGLTWAQWGRLFLINVLFMSILGFLTLDSLANINSKFAAIILSVLIPYVIVQWTQSLTPKQRTLQYGTGLLYYISLLLFNGHLYVGITCMLIPCIFISLFLLFKGKDLFRPIASQAVKA